ncbi:MAG TPA: hypothetical protein PKD37_05415 [Oligoflexia bacterium]|nr:hypothetical protein [Oligoflexia bacterium]HMP27404.1 hypothetical protein [Oligoflexia bacterium]
METILFFILALFGSAIGVYFIIKPLFLENQSVSSLLDNIPMTDLKKEQLTDLELDYATNKISSQEFLELKKKISNENHGN